MIGWIFAIYSLAVVLCSPFIPRLLERKRDKKGLVNKGLLLMSICFILFGVTVHIDNTTVLISIALAIRMLQGAASACIQTTCYSIATNEYPKEKEKLIGYIEAAMGGGGCMGPLVGSLIYAMGGFSITFYLLGIFIMLYVIVNTMI